MVTTRDDRCDKPGDDPENNVTTSDNIWWLKLPILLPKSIFACLADHHLWSVMKIKKIYLLQYLTDHIGVQGTKFIF
jgi:hypothetical protein